MADGPIATSERQGRLGVYRAVAVRARGSVAGGVVGVSGEASSESTFLLACGVSATFALVARTGASAVETVLARNEADIDPVTGALGASSFIRRADEALAQTERDGRPCSLIIFDIDSFSRVNAALGHAGGDRVLADIAQAVAAGSWRAGRVVSLGRRRVRSDMPDTEANAVVIAAEILAVIRGLSAR